MGLSGKQHGMLPAISAGAAEERGVDMASKVGMAAYTYDEETANEARGFSAFGGHLLAHADDTVAVQEDRHGATLGSLGIEDAEQLLAIAAIPEVREELQLMLSLKDQDFEAFLAQAQAALPAERAALV